METIDVDTDRLSNSSDQYDFYPEFNLVLLKIAKTITNMDPDDEELEDTRKKISISSSTNPEEPLRICYPFLEEYGHYIEDEKFSELLEDDVVNNIEDKNIKDLIEKLTGIYNEMGDEEKEFIHDLLTKLYLVYAIYNSKGFEN